MKKFLIIALPMLATALLCVGVQSCCPHKSGQCTSVTENDSVIASQVYNQVVNPTFESSEEAVEYMFQQQDQRHIDETFVKLDKNIISCVCQVLQDRGVPLSKNEIVKEYEARSEVYTSVTKTRQFRERGTPPDSVSDEERINIEEDCALWKKH